MNTISSLGELAPAASSCNMTIVPGRNDPSASGVASRPSTVLGTCFGGERHFHSTASSLSDIEFGSARSSRMRVSARTIPWTPIAVPCMAQRSSLARATSISRARRIRPVICQTIWIGEKPSRNSSISAAALQVSRSAE
jgi:hypothetical protein